MRGTIGKIRALGCDVDALTLEESVSTLAKWLDELREGAEAGDASSRPCRYVVTPNLDHVVLLRGNDELRQAYSQAAMVLADGMPLVWASRLFGRALPERVAGSDVAPGLLAAAKKGTRVYFLGASEESSLKAVENARALYPQIEVVGRLSPPMGFEHSEEWSDRIVSEIVESGTQLVIVGLGAPKQELWVHRHHERLPGTVVLCVGATIDFLAGSVARAPEWAQKSGVEWVHRLLSDPKRLAKRYGKDLLYLPLLLLSDLKNLSNAK